MLLGFRLGSFNEKEKINLPVRCMKCSKVLNTTEERDILVCNVCSKRKVKIIRRS